MRRKPSRILVVAIGAILGGAVWLPNGIEPGLGAQEQATALAVTQPDEGVAPAPAEPADKARPPAKAEDDAVAQEDLSSLSETALPETSGQQPSEESFETLSEVAAEDEMSLDAAIAAAKIRSTDEPLELSVPPVPSLYPEDIPAWINKEPDFSGEIHRLYVGSSAVAKPENVDEALGISLVAAVRDYLDQIVFQEQGAADLLDLNESYIRRNLLADAEGYVVPLRTSAGEMYEKWVTLEVTPAQRTQFLQLQEQAIQRSRLPVLGFGVLGVLAFLGMAHLVLRRGTAMPTYEPLVGENLVAQPAAKRSGGGFLAFLLFLGSIAFLLLVVGVFTLRGHRTSPVVRLEVPEISRHLPSGEKILIRHGGTEVLVEASEKDWISRESDVPQGTETIIESHGQKIYQRKIVRP